MTTYSNRQKRDWLAYRALYYAILGDLRRSEAIRRIVRRLDQTLPERHLDTKPVLV